jgi:plasmid stabilization system protein ParE
VNSKPVFALESVREDLKGAITHYLTWRSDGKEHILGKYKETVSWIEWNPELFPRVFGPVQRAILKQSYYIVYFLQEVDRTVILAVLDGRMGPKSIRNLVSQRGRTRR